MITFLKIPKNVMARHAMIWGFLMIYIIYSNFVEGSAFTKTVYLFCFTTNLAICYYLLLLIIFPNLIERKNILFIFGLFLVFTIFLSWDYFHLKKILPYFGGTTPRNQLSSFEFFKSSGLIFSFILFSALGSYLNRKSVEQFKELIEKEKNVISSELNFLKNQFNSHLTFNFFNFCYAKMLSISPKTAESVEDFTEMLHYPLKNKLNKKASLTEEIEYINQFIRVQNLISSEMYVNINVTGEIQNYHITPMILSVFVENAFKHGIFNEPENPIAILLNTTENNIQFEIKNKKKNQKTLIETGIGLENIQQILELFYKNKYTLSVENSINTYSVKLHLNTH